MTGQLDLLAEAPAPERRYTCCGQPCAPADAPIGTPGFPHADDCPNPNLDTFLDRALVAVEIMLANTRHALAAGEKPAVEEESSN